LSPCRRVHLVQDFAQHRCDVLSTALLENIDEIAVEELPGWVVLREIARVDIVGDIVELGVIDTPDPAKLNEVSATAIAKEREKKEKRKPHTY